MMSHSLSIGAGHCALPGHWCTGLSPPASLHSRSAWSVTATTKFTPTMTNLLHLTVEVFTVPVINMKL